MLMAVLSFRKQELMHYYWLRKRTVLSGFKNGKSVLLLWLIQLADDHLSNLGKPKVRCLLLKMYIVYIKHPIPMAKTDDKG